jgi:acyl transferase domain-containing protein
MIPAGSWGRERRSEDAISAVPLQRWDVEATREPRPLMRIRFGGFLGDVALFDATAFQISSAEADLMDPQQRLMLEVGHKQADRRRTSASAVGTCRGV